MKENSPVKQQTYGEFLKEMKENGLLVKLEEGDFYNISVEFFLKKEMQIESLGDFIQSLTDKEKIELFGQEYSQETEEKTNFFGKIFRKKIQPTFLREKFESDLKSYPLSLIAKIKKNQKYQEVFETFQIHKKLTPDKVKQFKKYIIQNLTIKMPNNEFGLKNIRVEDSKIFTQSLLYKELTDQQKVDFAINSDKVKGTSLDKNLQLYNKENLQIIAQEIKKKNPEIPLENIQNALMKEYLPKEQSQAQNQQQQQEIKVVQENFNQENLQPSLQKKNSIASTNLEEDNNSKIDLEDFQEDQLLSPDEKDPKYLTSSKIFLDKKLTQSTNQNKNENNNLNQIQQQQETPQVQVQKKLLQVAQVKYTKEKLMEDLGMTEESYGQFSEQVKSFLEKNQNKNKNDNNLNQIQQQQETPQTQVQEKLPQVAQVIHTEKKELMEDMFKTTENYQKFNTQVKSFLENLNNKSKISQQTSANSSQQVQSQVSQIKENLKKSVSNQQQTQSDTKTLSFVQREEKKVATATFGEAGKTRGGSWEI